MPRPEIPAVRLVIRRRCDVCGGSGEVRSEDWEAFEAWLERNRDVAGRATPEETFFLDVQRLDAVPPMNRECGACEGGWQDSDMPAEEFADAILALVPKSVIPRGELEDVARDVRNAITAAAQKSLGLADADEAGSWLRAVQEGAEALRAIGDALVRERER